MAKVKAPIEEEETVKCSYCGKEAKEVFLCSEKERIYCLKCHELKDEYGNPCINMSRCPHIQGEHKHILFPGKGNKNMDFIEEVIKISDSNRKQNGTREN